MKKLLAVILTSVLSVGMLPSAVFAKYDTDIEYSVNGGKIYFDKNRGVITDADESIRAAVIPSEIEGAEVKGIQSNAFAYCSSLESVEIPDTVTDIGPNAFKECTSLKEADLGDGVQTISSGAFSKCSSLTVLSIPAGVTDIGWNVFEGCTSLLNIDVSRDNTKYASENGVLFDDYEKVLIFYPPAKSAKSFEVPPETLKVADYAFADAVSLENVTLPDGLISIGTFAFARCKGLKSMEIPDSVTSIGVNGFGGCTGLESIKLPEGILSIEENTFYSCTALKEAVIPDSVRSIGKNAFYKCSVLENVKIPKSITTIGSSAFSYCTSLESVIIPGDMTTLETGVFEECSNLKKAVLPNCVKTIKNGAFHNCISLNEIIIPENVTSIGQSAFACCTSLKTVTIPKSVTTISAYAFNGCAVNGNTVIENVNYNGSESEWAGIYIGDYNNPLKEAKINYNCLMPLVYGDSETNIVVTMSEGALDSDAELFADKVSPSDAGASGLSDKAVVFDIYFVKNGQRIQPEGEAEVSIPIPAGMGGYRYKVYHIDVNGNKTEIKAKTENGCIVFTTAHFSYYAVDIDGSAVKAGDVNADGQVTAKDKAILNRYLAGWAGYEAQILSRDAADIDGDGNITAKDKAIFNRYLAGWDGYDEYFK